MDHPTPDVSVIIVNRNTRQMLRACLASLREEAVHARASVEIIVVDNASTDGSPEMVAQDFPEAHLVRNPENLGYGASNNQGIARARGRYIFLLNSDTEVHAGTIDAMVSRLEGNARLAGVAPRLLNPDGTIQRSCWPFPLKELVGNTLGLYRLRVLDDYRAWRHERDREVDWVSSAAMMVPRRVLDEVGGLDEEFFYGSDVEWAHRATRAGYRFLSICEGAVVHYGRGSRQGSRPVRPEYAGGPAIQAKYYRKHYGRAGVLLFRTLLIAGSVPRLIAWEILYVLGRRGDAAEKRQLFRRLIAAAWTLRSTPPARPSGESV